MADDDIQEGEPRKKKKAPPPDDDDDDRPRKKRPADDDDEDDRPRKKKKVARDDDEGGDLGDSILSAVVPVGGSIWALLSLYSSLLCFIPVLPLFGVLFGVIALMTHKHKASYGSITGNLRAILGIVIGLIVIVGQCVILFLWLTKKL
ncbi:MAG: hypothetical protein EXR98_03900 [Gemmataceae bacterium]|nr:hypothetical protein [Gemmataceae bacterium]